MYPIVELDTYCSVNEQVQGVKNRKVLLEKYG